MSCITYYLLKRTNSDVLALEIQRTDSGMFIALTEHHGNLSVYRSMLDLIDQHRLVVHNGMLPALNNDGCLIDHCYPNQEYREYPSLENALHELRKELFQTAAAPTTLKDPHQPGVKLDQGKPRTDLLITDFPRALLEIAKVLGYGASKYTEHGWQDVQNLQARYLGAQMRHLLTGQLEPSDPESEICHLAHEACNVLFRLEHQLRQLEQTP